MAKENIARFFEAAMTDKALAAKVAALAAKHGYGFTAAELLAFGATRPISDGDVKDVSGGRREYHLELANEKGAGRLW